MVLIKYMHMNIIHTDKNTNRYYDLSNKCARYIYYSRKIRILIFKFPRIVTEYLNMPILEY